MNKITEDIKIAGFSINEDSVLIERIKAKDITPIKVGFDINDYKYMEVQAPHNYTTVTIADQKVVVKNDGIKFDYHGGDQLTLFADTEIVSLHTTQSGEQFISTELHHITEDSVEQLTLDLKTMQEYEGENALEITGQENLHTMTKSVTIGGVTIENFTHSVIADRLDRTYYKDENDNYHLLFGDIAGPDDMAKTLVYFTKDASASVDNIYKAHRYDSQTQQFSEVSSSSFLLNTGIDTGHTMPMSNVMHELFHAVMPTDGSDLSNGYFFHTSGNHTHNTNQINIYQKNIVADPENPESVSTESTLYFQKHHDGSFQELKDFDGKKVAFEESDAVAELLVRYDFNEGDQVLEIGTTKVHYYVNADENYQLINTNGKLITNITRDIETGSTTENGYFVTTRGVSKFYQYDHSNKIITVDSDNFYYLDGENILRVNDTLPTGWETDPDFMLDIRNGYLGDYSEVTDFEGKGVYQFDYLDSAGTYPDEVYWRNANGEYVTVNSSKKLIMKDGEVGFYQLNTAHNTYEFMLFNTENGSSANSDTGDYYVDNAGTYHEIATGAWKTDGHKLVVLNGKVGYFDTAKVDLSDKLSKFVEVDSSTGDSQISSAEIYYNTSEDADVDSYARLINNDGSSFTDTAQLKISGTDLGYFVKTNGDLIYSFQKLSTSQSDASVAEDHKMTVTFAAEDSTQKTFYTELNGEYTQFTIDVSAPEDAVFASIDGTLVLQAKQTIKGEVDDNVYRAYVVDVVGNKLDGAIANTYFFKEDDNSFTALQLDEGSADNQWKTTDVMTKIGSDYGTLRAKSDDFESKDIFQFHKVSYASNEDGSVNLVEGKWYQEDGTHLAILDNKDLIADSTEAFYYEAEYSDNVYKKHVVSADLTSTSVYEHDGEEITYFKDESTIPIQYTEIFLPDNWDPTIHTLLGTDSASQKVGVDSNGDLVEVYALGTFQSPLVLDFTKFYSTADTDTGSVITDGSVVLHDVTGVYKEYTLDGSGIVSETKVFTDAAKTTDITSVWSDNAEENSMTFNEYTSTYNYVRKTDEGVFVKGSIDQTTGDQVDVANEYFADLTTTVQITGWTADHKLLSDGVSYSNLDATGMYQKGVLDSASGALTADADSKYYTDSTASKDVLGWSIDHKLLTDGISYTVKQTDGLYLQGTVNDSGVSTTIMNNPDNKHYLDVDAQNEIVGWDTTKHKYLGSNEYTESKTDGTYAKGTVGADGSTMTTDGKMYVSENGNVELTGVTWTGNHHLISSTQYSVLDTTSNSYNLGEVDVNGVAVTIDTNTEFIDQDGTTELLNFDPTTDIVTESDVYRQNSTTGAWIKGNESGDTTSAPYYLKDGTLIDNFDWQDRLIDSVVYRKDANTSLWQTGDIAGTTDTDNYYWSDGIKIESFDSSTDKFIAGYFYRHDSETGAWKKGGKTGNDANDSYYYLDTGNVIISFDSITDKVVEGFVYRQDDTTSAWQKGDRYGVSDTTHYYLNDGQAITGFITTSRYISDSEIYVKDSTTGAWQKHAVDTSDGSLSVVGGEESNYYMQNGTAIVSFDTSTDTVISGFVYRQDSTTGAWQQGDATEIDSTNLNYYLSNGVKITDFDSDSVYVSDLAIYRQDSVTGTWQKNNSTNDAVSDGKYYLRDTTEIVDFSSEDRLIGEFAYRQDDTTGAWQKNNAANDDISDNMYYLNDGQAITGFTTTSRYVSDSEIYVKDSTTGAWQKHEVDTSDGSLSIVVGEESNYYLNDGQLIVGFISTSSYVNDNEVYIKVVDDTGVDRWQKYEVNTADGDNVNAALQIVSTDSNTYYTDVSGANTFPAVEYSQDVDTGTWIQSKEHGVSVVHDGKYYWSNDSGATVKEITGFTADHTLIEDGDSYYVTKSLTGTTLFEGGSADTSGTDVTFTFESGFLTSENDVTTNNFLQDLRTTGTANYDTHNTDVSVIYHYIDNIVENKKKMFFYNYSDDKHYRIVDNGISVSYSVENATKDEYETNADELPIDLGVFFAYKTGDATVGSDFTYKIADNIWGRATLDSASDAGVTFTWNNFYDSETNANTDDGSTGLLTHQVSGTTFNNYDQTAGVLYATDTTSANTLDYYDFGTGDYGQISTVTGNENGTKTYYIDLDNSGSYDPATEDASNTVESTPFATLYDSLSNIWV